MTWEEWRNMGEMMGGVAAMGGPATGLLKNRPTPSPAPGGMDHGRHAPSRSRAAPTPGQPSDSAAKDRVQQDSHPAEAHEGHQ